MLIRSFHSRATHSIQRNPICKACCTKRAPFPAKQRPQTPPETEGKVSFGCCWLALAGRLGLADRSHSQQSHSQQSWWAELCGQLAGLQLTGDCMQPFGYFHSSCQLAGWQARASVRVGRPEKARELRAALSCTRFMLRRLQQEPGGRQREPIGISLAGNCGRRKIGPICGSSRARFLVSRPSGLGQFGRLECCTLPHCIHLALSLFGSLAQRLSAAL